VSQRRTMPYLLRLSDITFKLHIWGYFVRVLINHMSLSHLSGFGVDGLTSFVNYGHSKLFVVRLVL
jgi:hypothetical protein